MDIEALKDKTYPMCALYVEDDDEVRAQTAKILRLFFSVVIECDNGCDGVNICKKHGVDIVFTDINMPGINGLEMIEEIKKAAPNIKTVIFSAYDEARFFTKAIDIGVDGYVLKPFLTSELLSILEKITQTKSAKSKNLVSLSGGFIWDRCGSNLLKEGNAVKLTKNEIALLELLLSAKDGTVTSYEIENELFDDEISDNKRVRNLVSRFHKKIGYKLIENIYSQGYKIKWQF